MTRSRWSLALSLGVWLGVSLGVSVARPATLAGQQKPSARATGVIAGTVKDETGTPIPNVEVTAIRTAATARSDTAGHFMLTVPAGSVDLNVRRLAYEPILLMMQVSANDTAEVDVTLSIVAQKLTGVIILADAVQRRQLDAFEARRKLGFGHFITRYQIERRNPRLLSDMTYLVPGATLIQLPNGRAVLRFSRGSARDCPPQYYVDGMMITGFNIDDTPPGDVEGVEFYSGSSTVPVEFSRINSTSNCGVVAIWTRIPGNQKAKP